MFDNRFNSGFVNTVSTQDTNYRPNQDNYFGKTETVPYMQNMNIPEPSTMQGSPSASDLYPLESSTATPYLNNNNVSRYAKGGSVKPKRSKSKVSNDNPYPMLAEMIRKQGIGDDTILAHINPIEALILKGVGGSGEPNPVTGLPQFSFWSNPLKATKSILGGAGGAIIGNMLLPGVGGVIGGAIGQGLQNKVRNKSVLGGALKGATMGAAIPGVAGLLGSGASSLGASGAGNFLSNYGSANAVLPSLGISGGASGALKTVGGEQAALSAASKGAAANQGGFLESLGNNSSSYFSKPSNLLALATTAGALAGRKKEPKEKTPEQIAQEQKRFQLGMLLTPEEQAQKEAAMLADAQSKRRVNRNKFLPEERFTVEPLYRKSNSPEEYQKKKRWIEYYNNPEFSGNSANFKKGGSTSPYFVEEVEKFTNKPAMFLDGYTKGQSDKIDAELSDGEYVIPADVVSHQGDGNNKAGAMEFDHLISAIRKNSGAPNKLPPKAKPLMSYMKKRVA